MGRWLVAFTSRHLTHMPDYRQHMAQPRKLEGLLRKWKGVLHACVHASGALNGFAFAFAAASVCRVIRTMIDTPTDCIPYITPLHPHSLTHSSPRQGATPPEKCSGQVWHSDAEENTNQERWMHSAVMFVLCRVMLRCVLFVCVVCVSRKRTDTHTR